jgi:xanthine/CO dehydrogenase XdhC/CoxF family maturation factor
LQPLRGLTQKNCGKKPGCEQGERVKEEYGLLDEELDLVTTPIGLPIKGETPAEIAISIAAQMILHRAERSGL